MKRIPLTQDKFAIVDDEDYEWLNQWKWCCVKIRRTFYAVRKTKIGKYWQTLYMHREILNTPQHLQVDHLNHNGLINKKDNIRNCTMKQNMRNRYPYTNTTSRYKGVCFYKRTKKWRAYLQCEGFMHIGYYEKEIDAARAYNEKAKKIFGKYAYINKVLDGR